MNLMHNDRSEKNPWRRSSLFDSKSWEKIKKGITGQRQKNMVSVQTTRRITYVLMALTGVGILVLVWYWWKSRSNNGDTTKSTAPSGGTASANSAQPVTYTVYPNYAATGSRYGMTVTGGTTYEKVRTCSLNPKCSGMTFNLGANVASQILDSDSAANKVVTKRDANYELMVKPTKVATFSGASDVKDPGSYVDTWTADDQSSVAPTISKGVSVGAGASGVSLSNAPAADMYQYACASDPNCVGMYYTASSGTGKAIMRNDPETSRTGVATTGVDLYVKPSQSKLFSIK